MGKVVLAFLFFISASCLAIREARPLPAADPPRPEPAYVREPPPSRAIHDPVPPWVRHVMPQPEPPPPPPLQVIVTKVPPRVVTIERDGDFVEICDRCPDSPEDNRDDDDGCPEITIENHPAPPEIILENVDLVY